jgi:glycosyltransferase involved in cell wall biosynthesis
MPKILIVTDNLPNQINGVVTTYKNIETYAIRDGYTIDYIHPGMYGHIDCPKYNEVKLAWAPPWVVGKEIKKIDPDYIHIATEGPMGMSARRYLAIRGIKYNTAYHTKFPEGVRTLLGIPEGITWAVVRWFHKNSNKVLTTTKSMVNELRAHGFNNNVIHWTRGVDRDIFKPAVKEPCSHINLVCVSRVSKEKNLEAFLEINYPNAVKTIVGDGPMLETYKKQYPDVNFVGAKRGAELAHYYQQADVFVFPSRWDTFGLVMIEAMACGTPVAAYPVQGPLDVVDQDVTGYMDEDITIAIKKSLDLDRESVYKFSMKWDWGNAWNIFRDNLINCKLTRG